MNNSITTCSFNLNRMIVLNNYVPSFKEMIQTDSKKNSVTIEKGISP